MNMVMAILVQFIYPPPPSLLVTAMSVITVASLVNGGLSEMRGKSIQYSKFWNVGSHQKSTAKLSGKTGMLTAYTPAFLFSLASFAPLPYEAEGLSLRVMLLKTALTIHFSKRIFEVLFVHKYSGPMFLDIAIFISLSYFIITSSMIYAQLLTLGLQEPPIDLKYAGVVFFLVGLSGNCWWEWDFKPLMVIEKTTQRDEFGAAKKHSVFSETN